MRNCQHLSLIPHRRACLARRAIFALICLPLLYGCGTAGPETAVTTGLVTHQGSPVSNATVLFQPADTNSGKPCQASTDASGRFEMTTFVDNNQTKSGVIPGLYRVAITKMELKEGQMVAPKNELPKQFANPMNSKLTAEVVAGTENDFPFNLDG